ncbi:MAG: B12-binding domain-containing protein, partial [Planctomycetota bacterium]
GLELGEPLVQRERENGADDAVGPLVDAFLASDVARASQLVMGAYFGGSAVADICDDLLSPAMRRVGDLWQGGHDGVLEEHRATSVCRLLVTRLSELLSRPAGASAVGGAIEVDPYSIPSQMAEAVLRSSGYDAFDLGPNTPVDVICSAADQASARVVWISVNFVRDPVTTRKQLSDAFAQNAGPQRDFVVGGRELGTLDLPAIDHVHRASGMRDLGRIAASFVSA